MDANRLSALVTRAKAARSQVEQRKGQRSKLLEQQTRLQVDLAEKRDIHETAVLAIEVLRAAGDFAREQARQQVEALASMALTAVFGPGYRFSLVSKKQGNQTAIECRVVSPDGKGGEVDTEGSDSRGGGVVDIQALALRVSMLELYQPGIDGPLMLDEPGKHVSAGLIEDLGRFLMLVSEQFGRQLIMVTHNETLAAMSANTIKIELRDGVSVVTAA